MADERAQSLRTTCCIAGGGPAGMVLGLLLARAGIDVTVLEKHGDFLRDFRGDTVHASTIRVMDELGFGERFRRVPHQPFTRLQVLIGGETAIAADLSRKANADRRLWFMPQWDFLDFVAAEARRYPGFRLLMNAEVTGVIGDGHVAGVAYRSAGETGEVRADLTVACDGRASTLRATAGLEPIHFGAPMDVLWFRLSKRPSDADGAYFCVGSVGVLILLDRGDYWQAGYVIPKDSFTGMESGGIGPIRRSLGSLAPFLADGRLDAVVWEDLKLLRVQVNRLSRWYGPGLLLIGDAAHAMSPVGGVGINLAIQDAVAAANALAGPLTRGRITEADLARVQRRRAAATIVTQTGQRILQRQFLGRVLAGGEPRIPRLLRHRLAQRLVPHLIGAGLRVAGSGVRPEHVRTPAVPHQ